MAYKQVKKANPNVPAQVNMCLKYAREVFKIGAKHPTAWKAWSASKTKHKNRVFPKGVAFPVWYSYFTGGQNFGHVAIVMPSGITYSSPIGGRKKFTNIQALERAASNIKFVGWTEDVNDVRVIAKMADDGYKKKYEQANKALEACKKQYKKKSAERNSFLKIVLKVKNAFKKGK